MVVPLRAGRSTRAVAREIPFADPTVLYERLRRPDIAAGRISALLDSAAPALDTGRYAIVACDPVAEIRAAPHGAFDHLQTILSALPVVSPPPGWPFTPALLGSFGYGLRTALESV